MTLKRATLDVAALLRDPTCSITEAAQVLGVSRSYAYDMTVTGRLPVIMLGERRKRVPTAALRRILQLDACPAGE